MNRTKSSDQQSTTNPTIPVCWSCNHMMCWTPLTESEISVKGTQTRPYTVRWIVSSNKKSQFWNTIPCWYFPIFDGSDPVQSLKLWFFNPWNSPAVGKPRKPPERFVHLLATSKGLQLNTTVHGFTQGLANDWAGNENRIFDRWQKKWWCLPYDTLT